MRIQERQSGDAERLRAAARIASSRDQRDRYLAVALSVAGVAAADIQRNLGRSRGFVQRWAYAYRDGGVEALHPRQRPGRTPRIPHDIQVQVVRRAADHAPSAVEVRRILAQEFGVRYSLRGVYAMMSKLRATHNMRTKCDSTSQMPITSVEKL